MNPIGLAAGAIAGAAVGATIYKKMKKPVKSDYQGMSTLGAGGTPIKVMTPVPNVVTPAQASATPYQAPLMGIIFPVPTTVPGTGVVYAPPGTIDAAPGGGVLQPAPIVVSPGGASSIAIGSVKDVQHALNTLGVCNPPLKEDGVLGPKTSSCIKLFQSKSGGKLVVDGNAGPATRAALSAALGNMAGAMPIAPPPAQNVDTSAALAMSKTEIQHRLNLLGASPSLVEDGNLGPKSIAAIKSFQTTSGLIPDGIAGPKTKTALYLASLQAAA